MDLFPLSLYANPRNWRLFLLRKADPSFNKVKGEVISRDNSTCRFCGFKANKFQEIVNLDFDYHNNKISNLATSCCLCTQCFFLESVGKSEYGGGVLIYLPEISQAELNALCHVLFCAIINKTNFQNDAQNIYRTLKLRGKLVEQNFGEGMQNPAVIGQLLIDSSNKDQNLKNKILEHIRLLPAQERFDKQVQIWTQNL